MVNWSIAWLEKFDAINVKVKLWAVKKDADFSHSNLAGNDLEYSFQ